MRHTIVVGAASDAGAPALDFAVARARPLGAGIVLAGVAAPGADLDELDQAQALAGTAPHHVP